MQVRPFQYDGSTSGGPSLIPVFWVHHLSTTTIPYHGSTSTFRLFTSSLFQVLVLVVAWLASSLAFAGLQPEPARLLTGDRFLDLALQGPLTFLLCIDWICTTFTFRWACNCYGSIDRTPCCWLWSKVFKFSSFHFQLIEICQMASLPPPLPAGPLLPVPHLSWSHPPPRPHHPPHRPHHHRPLLCFRHDLPSLPLLVRAGAHLLESTQPGLLLLSCCSWQFDSSLPLQDRPPPPRCSSRRPRSAGLASSHPCSSPA